MKYVRILMPAGDWEAGGFFDFVWTNEAAPGIAVDPPATDMDKTTFDGYVRFVSYYIHQVNLMRHLLGEPYAVTHADPGGVLLVGRSASGIACTIEMTPYRTTVDWQESALVCFEKGYVRLELPAPMVVNRPGRVEVLRDPGSGVRPETTVPQLPWVHAMRQQAVNFLAAVRGEKPPTCSADEALEDLKIAREYLRLLKGVGHRLRPAGQGRRSWHLLRRHRPQRRWAARHRRTGQRRPGHFSQRRALTRAFHPTTQARPRRPRQKLRAACSTLARSAWHRATACCVCTRAHIESDKGGRYP